jgi:hypothetical protein
MKAKVKATWPEVGELLVAFGQEKFRKGFCAALEKVAAEFHDKEFRYGETIGADEVQAFLDTRHVHYEECRQESATSKPQGMAQHDIMRKALQSIAANTCCDTCQEARKVAMHALDAANERSIIP